MRVYWMVNPPPTLYNDNRGGVVWVKAFEMINADAIVRNRLVLLQQIFPTPRGVFTEHQIGTIGTCKLLFINAFELLSEQVSRGLPRLDQSIEEWGSVRHRCPASLRSARYCVGNAVWPANHGCVTSRSPGQRSANGDGQNTVWNFSCSSLSG